MQIDSVHFYVTNATNTSNWFINCLGFQLIDCYQDDHSLTIAIAETNILLIISSPLNNDSPVAHYLADYAPGIIDITFRVNRLQKIINQVQISGREILQPIQQKGKIYYSCVPGWESLQHTLFDSPSQNHCYLLPSGKLKVISLDQQLASRRSNWINIDHVVLNVPQGKLKQAVNYYQSLFDFQVQQTFTIKTKQSGLFSQALIDSTGQVQFNINEPTTENSQIQEFIELNGGSGIQHLALRTDNLIEDIAKMRAHKVAFLPIPLAYYPQLKQCLQENFIKIRPQEIAMIARQEILIDWQKKSPQSLLLQIFTQPILEKPTFFLEFIERRQQATGFGEGNFNALFAAVEQEQIKSYKL
jgi:4-hydroxyphenylpyruvate dioxygenase